MAHSIGVAMAGGNPLLGRKKHDFYATPSDCTHALFLKLEELGVKVRGKITEPCCGDGAICKVAIERGYEVVATDLIDQGYGDHGGGHDATRIESLPSPSVITNPPFNLAPKIIESVMRHDPDLFVLLLKASFWSAARRKALFRKYRPSAILTLSWRPDFAGLGNPTMECAWIVWSKQMTPGVTVFDILDRPKGYEVKSAIRPKKAKAPKPEAPPASDARPEWNVAQTQLDLYDRVA